MYKEINLVMMMCIKKLLLLFMMISLVCSSFAFAEDAKISITTTEGKNVYYEGEDVNFEVYMEPNVNGQSVAFYDTDVLVQGFANNYLSFVQGSGTNGLIYANLEPNDVDGGSKSNGVYYGWFAKGLNNNVITLSQSKLLFKFKAKVLELPLGQTEQFPLNLPKPKSKITNYPTDVENPVDVTFLAVPFTIVLKDRCGNGVCDAANSEDVNNCFNDCGCKADTDCSGQKCILAGSYKGKCTDGALNSICNVNNDCAAGTFCHATNHVCVSGDVGDKCSPTATEVQCKIGNYCTGDLCTAGDVDNVCNNDNQCDSGKCNIGIFKCTVGNENDACTDNADCLSNGCVNSYCTKPQVVDSDKDGIDDSKENQLCKLNTPNPLKQGVTVFSVGHTYAGCVKGDMNNDGLVNGQDYMKWIDQYILQASNPIKTQASLGDMSSDDLVNGQDYMKWINIYNLFASS